MLKLMFQVGCGFKYSDRIKDITLAGNGNLPNLQEMFVSGWGETVRCYVKLRAG
jgi:hypothetical protein